MNRSSFIFIAIIAILVLGPVSLAQDTGKAKTISALEALDKLRADPKTTFLVDVRSRFEYALLGHPPQAYNVPWRFMTTQFQVKGGKTADGEAQNTGYQPSAQPNPDFVKVVKSLFKPGDTIIVISAQGKDGAEAAAALAKDGFKQIFNIRHGFWGDPLVPAEQEKLAEKYSPRYLSQGKVNGWVFWGLPVVKTIDPRYIYPPDVKRLKPGK